jgi:hypothetical protein
LRHIKLTAVNSRKPLISRYFFTACFGNYRRSKAFHTISLDAQPQGGPDPIRDSANPGRAESVGPSYRRRFATRVSTFTTDCANA